MRERYHTDQAHGRRLPQGRALESALRRFFSRQRGEALQALRHGQRLDLRRWLPTMVETLKPAYGELFRGGMRNAAAMLKQPRRKNWRRTKAEPTGIPGLEFAFDVFDPRVLQAVDNAVFAFCQETLATLTGDFVQLRDEFRTGLEGGETYRELSWRVAQVFSDEHRAARIARSESTRAMHAGETWSMAETGVVGGKQWLASSDACDLCLELAAMGDVPLDEPYKTVGSGPYARIMHPPAHPWCMCSQTYTLDEDALGLASTGTRGRGSMAYGRETTGARGGLLAASWRGGVRK